METYACVSAAGMPCILKTDTDLEGFLADFGGLA